MNFFLILITLLSITHFTFCTEIKSLEDFKKEIEAAFNSKDPQRYLALHYMEGMEQEFIDKIPKSFIDFFSKEEIESISDSQYLNGDPKILNGFMYEPTAPPIGNIIVCFKKKPDSKNISTSSLQTQLSYTTVNGRYFLVGVKKIPLPWNGPHDKRIEFFAAGLNGKNGKIIYQYNASGIDVNTSTTAASLTTFGQYFSKISVFSDDAGNEITLTVTEDQKEIYKSERLKGIGKIEYIRPSSP
jgi:hypothetical protein